MKRRSAALAARVGAEIVPGWRRCPNRQISGRRAGWFRPHAYAHHEAAEKIDVRGPVLPVVEPLLSPTSSAGFDTLRLRAPTRHFNLQRRLAEGDPTHVGFALRTDRGRVRTARRRRDCNRRRGGALAGLIGIDRLRCSGRRRRPRLTPRRWQGNGTPHGQKAGRSRGNATRILSCA